MTEEDDNLVLYLRKQIAKANNLSLTDLDIVDDATYSVYFNKYFDNLRSSFGNKWTGIEQTGSTCG